ncbi:hypothetical protein KRP22_013078 [Phytophthora ramorum]|nr:Cysteine synthase [Phytophthora ramorum]
MPDITAKEKVQMMKTMGAEVHILPTTSMSDKENHFFTWPRSQETNAYCPTNSTTCQCARTMKEQLRRSGNSALNVLGAVKMARELGPGHTIVTILADGGVRYGSKLYNEEWLAEHNLLPQAAATTKGSASLDFVGKLGFPTTV